MFDSEIVCQTNWAQVDTLMYLNKGVQRLAVPPLKFSEALHGVAVGCGAKTNGNTGMQDQGVKHLFFRQKQQFKVN